MRAEVKSIISPDISDFITYYPEDDTLFLFLLQITIGTKNIEGGDSFQIEVCTPKWLMQNYNENEIIFPRGKLIVFEYDLEKILKRITDYCDSCEGATWEEIVCKISRIALWEFEDYRAGNT
jgi:hypothetical protein